MSFPSLPRLGFGLMRLPMIEREIDMFQLQQMVDLFMSRGFTYFDTAYGYYNGKSETAIRQALVARYPRYRFHLATKLPAWMAKSAEEARDMFWTSLERTGAGYFDAYLLHNLGDTRIAFFDRYGIWDFLAGQKKAGRIRQLGFSFHDKASVLDDILDKHPEMDFVQLQINYADWENPAVESRLCYETARRHNKPIIIMEPVKGGSLSELPENIAADFKQYDAAPSLSSWALRFAASLEGVVMVLSGMSDLAQMQDNLAIMEHFRPLDEKELAVIERARIKLANLPHIGCTACHYCEKGCPQEIAISGIFAAMNTYLIFGNKKGARRNYKMATRSGGTASRCIACGQCESVCPQHISIIDELKKVAEFIGG